MILWCLPSEYVADFSSYKGFKNEVVLSLEISYFRVAAGVSAGVSLGARVEERSVFLIAKTYDKIMLNY